MKVPKSEVRLTIATDSLRNLPVGASYSGRSSQASVDVMRKAATATDPEYIYVYASCDSLTLLCERYERQILNMSIVNSELERELSASKSATKHDDEEVKEKPPNGIITSLKWLLAGIIIGTISTIILFIRFRK